MGCHNSQKAKGELVMETEPLLLKGGKHGALWQAGEPAASLLIQRIDLPAAEKKHMPPAGKPQLEEEEAAILFQWIKNGADFKRKVTDLPAADSLRLLADNLFGKPAAEAYDFSAAGEKEIEKLNNTNRLVHPLALSSPALAVNFYNRQNYTTALLKELLAVKTQVVSLDMAYMPLKEADIELVTQFSNLRSLNLNFSTVPGKSLAALKKLPNLHRLSLSGTSIDQKEVEALTSFPALHAVYLWNVPMAANEITAIKKMNAAIVFETGYMNDTVVLKLNQPVLETEERIIQGQPLAVKLKHYIKGVTIRYTTDGSSPDSLHAAIYKDEVVIDKSGVLKARAFKPGWLGSDSIVATFYKNTYRADSIRSLTALDSVYKGSAGARTLINGEKGDMNRNNRWLGFRRNNMEMLLHYATPVLVSSVALSAQVDAGAFVMPPAAMEVWGGTTEKHLVRLARIIPPQPDSLQAGYMRSYECTFTPTRISYLKVVAIPVARLPAWHPSKGQKGWLFTDELFVN